MSDRPALVVAACALSAGIHPGLAPEHFAESPPLAVAGQSAHDHGVR